MRILLMLAGLMFCLAAESQEIWRWVDKDGVVHYADQPGAPDAKLITVVVSNVYEGETTPGDSASGGESGGGAADSAYGSITIVQPQHDQVFFGSAATVSVVAELDGSLQSGQSIVFFVDGNRRPADGFGLELTDVPRGSHFLRATVVDSSGEAVMSSRQITFHVRQTSVQNPQNPLRPRPPASPPRPTPQPPATPPTPRPIPPGT